MNNLLNELEALQISGDFWEDRLWTVCNDLVQKSFVPEKIVGFDRPCEEKDFREYRQIVDRNLRNIRSMLQHSIYNLNQGHVQINAYEPAVQTFIVSLLLLVGEQQEKNVWNTAESVLICKELAKPIEQMLELYKYQSISKFLDEPDNFKTLWLALKPKLRKDTWKAYPAAVACYKWILYQTEKPCLYYWVEDVLPTALLIINDYVTDNVVIGLECLHQIIQHCSLKKIFVNTRNAKRIFKTLTYLTHRREPKYVTLVYSCLMSLMAISEQSNTARDVFNWTKRDDVLNGLLDQMEFECDVELRRAYMSSLPQLLTNVGCAKWGERLARILSEYCEHHTDLKTLKATLKAAKTILLMFHFRLPAYDVPLYTVFLKLHIDLTKTPVFDKEIMQNLEDCILLLYKQSPNVGRAVMNDVRMHSVIKHRLQVACLGDTKYFQ